MFAPKVFMKSIKNKFIILAAVLSVFASGIGCRHHEEGLRLVKNTDFSKVSDYNLKLIIPLSQRQLQSGTKTQITFTLMNHGNKAVMLLDWRLREQENIRLYYRPYEPSLDKFDITDPEWKKFETIPKLPVRYNIQTIAPGNLFSISTNFPFSEQRGKYWLVAELTLTSVDVRSEAAIIEIE